MPRPSTPAMALILLMLSSVSCGGDGGGGVDGHDPGTTVPNTADEIVACQVDEVDGDLYLYNWRDYMDPELVSKFESEFGGEVLVDFYDSNEALLAKLRSGAIYDLVVPSDYMVGAMIEEGLLAELQRDAVPNIGNLDPFFASPSYDVGGTYSVAYQWGTTGLAIDLAVIGEDFEPSWALVFDPELVSDYPAGISLLDDPRQTLGAALKYLGYSVNSESETELQAAADLVAGINDGVMTFHDGDPGEQVAIGGVTISHGNSDSLREAIDDTADGGSRYAYVVPEEGGAVWIDNMAIPANAEHPCSAHTFMNFLLDAENGAALTNWTYQASPNEAAEAFILPEILEDEAIYPPADVLERLEVITDTGDFESKYDEYFAIARS